MAGLFFVFRKARSVVVIHVLACFCAPRSWEKSARAPLRALARHGGARKVSFVIQTIGPMWGAECFRRPAVSSIAIE